MMRTCVVIPAFNEAATIRGLAERVLQQVPRLWIVDDGSSDATVAELDGLPVRLLRHPTNQGKASSLWDGMQAALAAGADAVITLDGDGQHAPEDIPRLMQAAQRRPSQIIIGSRLRKREKAPRARRFANAFADFWISWASGARISDSQSGFRLYPAALLEKVRVAHGKNRGFVFESEILIEAARAGFSCHSIVIDTCYPEQARKSHFRPLTDISAIVLMVAGKLLASGMNPRGLLRILSRDGD
jgi:glycosyltransferase involved in cell wall biosynthesis